MTLVDLLGYPWQPLNTASGSSLDSFPITAGDHDRMPRAKCYQPGEYRGYSASKKGYFSGRTLQLMVTNDGQPVECVLPPGSYREVRALKTVQVEVPEGSRIEADKADHDDALAEL